MMKLVAEDVDVAEIYSRSHVTKRAEQNGLNGDRGLDLATKDRDGKPWDFASPTMRERAVNKINNDKPLLSVGGPVCTGWSAMMDLNWPRMTAEETARRMHEARKHLGFCFKIYKRQVSGGRHYLLEHPVAAKSWQEPESKAMLKEEHNTLPRLDQCQGG